MKLRKIVTSLFMVLLLSSCAKQLRSDIKEFVASFSLSESMSTYKHAGYTSVKISEVDGVKTEENISLSFNTLDEENLSYTFTKKTKINDGEENIFQKFLTKNDGKYFLNETDKEPVEYSVDQINLLVQEFFYKNVMYEGTYHCNGMYYGDLILETISELQGFVEIDQEKQWYIFSHKTSGKVDGKDSSVEQYYSVNKLGMLIQNISKQSYGSDYINQEINVFTL